MTKNKDQKIVKASITFEQGFDDHAVGPDDNVLEVETHISKDDPYISIRTQHWALELDEIDAFAESLKNVLRMANT